MDATPTNELRPLSRRALIQIKIEAVLGLPATLTTPQAIAARRFVESELAALRTGGCIAIPNELEEVPEPADLRHAASRQRCRGSFVELRKKVEPS